MVSVDGNLFIGNTIKLSVSVSSLKYHIGTALVYCGALMYADDLALIADSPAELQAFLEIAADYASRWRYSFNASKSFVLVFGESSRLHGF